MLLVVFFKLLFGKELDDTLEKEKRRESAPTAVATDDQPKQKSTGHDELTKVCAAEEAERRASQPQPPTVERDHTSPKQPEGTNGVTARRAVEDDGKSQEDQSYISQATTAASNLANSVVAVYAALGFGNSSSSSSDSEASSRRSSSTQPPNRSMTVEIDNMNDETVEQYLQSRQGSV